MYRSERADRRHFFYQLKIWIACSVFLILVGVGVLVYFLVAMEADETVYALAEIPNTYFETLTMAAIKVNNTYISYGIQEIIEEPEIPVYRIPTNTPGVYRTKIIALTFDDGPSWLTEELLDILDAYGARVTFCVIGDRVEDHSETIVRAFEAGHEIVGHSWDHRILTRLSVQNISAQITQTSEIIEQVTGEPSPPFFRAPYGHFNNRIKNAATDLGYSVLNWSIDTLDWRYRCEEHIYEHIMEYACDGAIVLLHDIHPTTILAMETVIPALINLGYELVTVSELVYYIYGELEPGVMFTGLRQ
ncbi:MAG: polysaccharide deacetylase family protein [Defluviitaleaceae bacterium]|nr:polysaccharide deacetylase family protein [Defluviitaleaceae bacterium]